LKSFEGEPKVGLLKNCISKAKGSFRLHQISKETMSMVVDRSLMDTAESSEQEEKQPKTTV